jgi:hypothetical protein
LLEPKADLKDRIGFSPDEFDALILTFARPVTVPEHRPRYREEVEMEYNPFRESDVGWVSSSAMTTIRLDDHLWSTWPVSP